eukprot:gene2928-1170_t
MKDWRRIKQGCDGLIEWGSTKRGWDERTDAGKSIVIAMDIRRTYEFSRVWIESRTSDNSAKKIGGDSWRVHLRGPSSPSATVFDHRNGTYEVAFLLIEPGTYTLKAYLEHSLCDGLKDPPDNWFIVGNAQGKYQPQGTLGLDHAYISKKLNPLRPLQINIQEQESLEYTQAVQMLMENGHKICKDNCSFIWDGQGRWIDDKWHPYQRSKSFEKETSLRPINKNHDGTLWFYGDSVMAQFYNNIKLFGKLCHMFSGGCGHTYNWVYKITGYNTTRAKIENDDKDFNVTRITDEVLQVISSPWINKPESVIIMNFGLHFTESSSFSNYKTLITRLINIIKHEKRFQGRVIWRTTTALNKHKLGGKDQHSRRFLTQQRVILFNAFATSQMCNAGIPILDLFPLTDSYPKGSGIAGYQFDAVHYEHSTFAKAERLLEEVMKRKVI